MTAAAPAIIHNLMEMFISDGEDFTVTAHGASTLFMCF
jgi:hypothetical protein